MVSQVTLGNFFNQNGRTVLGGVGGSGLDTKALIDGLAEAKGFAAKKLQDKIDINTKQSSAIGELKTLLSKFQDAANFLRNPTGFGNNASNIFQFSQATINSNTAVPGTSYVNVTAEVGASKQSYTINEITSVAAAAKQATQSFALADANASAVDATSSTGRFGAGTITVKGKNITLAQGDGLNAVAGKFNAVSDSTGITASVVQVNTGEYKLTFSATETGLDANFDLGNASTVSSDPAGVLSGLTFNTTQTASNAVFKIDNVEITRQTNSISDVIQGVTFNLQAPTPALTKLTVSIQPDTAIAKNGVLNFVNSYNDLKTFYSKQTQLDDKGVLSADAVLGNNSTLRSLLNQVNNEISGVVSGLGSNKSRLGDLGISFTDLPATKDNPLVRNILNADESKLSGAISSDFNAVAKVFGFFATSSSTDFSVFGYTNALQANRFSVDTNFAKPQIQTGGDFVIADAGQPVVTASATAGFLKAGSFTLAGQTITLNDGDTLDNVVQKFNNVTTSSHISAQVNDLGNGHFGIKFTGSLSGTQNAFDLNDNGLVSDPDSVLNGTLFTTTQATTDTKFSASAATIQSTGNFPALTTASVVKAGNEAGYFKAGDFTLKGQTITLSDGDTLNQVEQKFNAVSSLTGITANIIRGSDGSRQLEFQGKTGLANAFDFTKNTSVSDGNGVLATINFNTTQKAFNAIELTSTKVESSYRLSAAAGSPLEGLILFYGGNKDETITVNTTLGVAARTYNTLDAALKNNTGSLALNVQNIESTNKKYQADIDTINKQVSQFREQLLARFSALEAALSKVNTVLQSLDAQANARNNS